MIILKVNRFIFNANQVAHLNSNMIILKEKKFMFLMKYIKNLNSNMIILKVGIFNPNCKFLYSFKFQYDNT